MNKETGFHTQAPFEMAYVTPQLKELAVPCATAIAGWIEDSNGLTRPKTIDEILESFTLGNSIVAWANSSPGSKGEEYILAGHIAITGSTRTNGQSSAEVGSLVVNPKLRKHGVAGQLIRKITENVYDHQTSPYIGENPHLFAIATSDKSARAFARNGYADAQFLYRLSNEQMLDYIEEGKRLMVYLKPDILLA